MLSMGSMERLQNELRALKQQYRKGVAIKKTSKDDSPVAPFPVTLRRTIVASVPNAMYDVQEVQVQLTLQRQLVEDGSSVTCRAAGLSVVAVHPRLPARLLNKIALTLQQGWEEAFTSDVACSSFCLDVPFSYAATHFFSLMTSVTELVEAYESVDESGATVRRYAIINEDQQVQLDIASVPAPSTRDTPPACSSPPPAPSRSTTPTPTLPHHSAATPVPSRTASAVHHMAQSTVHPNVHDAAYQSAAPQHSRGRPPDHPATDPRDSTISPPPALPTRSPVTLDALSRLPGVPPDVPQELAQVQKRYGSDAIQGMWVELREDSSGAEASHTDPHIHSDTPHMHCSTAGGALGQATNCSVHPNRASVETGKEDGLIGSMGSEQSVMKAAGSTERRGSAVGHVGSVHFAMQIAPTDPDWDLGALALTGRIVCGSYPGPSGLDIRVPDWYPLPEDTRKLLSHMISLHVAHMVGSGRTLGQPQVGGWGVTWARGTPLRLLHGVLRQIENHVGHMLHEAEDMALEVQRKRAQGSAAQYTPSLHSLRPEPAHQHDAAASSTQRTAHSNCSVSLPDGVAMSVGSSPREALHPVGVAYVHDASRAGEQRALDFDGWDDVLVDGGQRRSSGSGGSEDDSLDGSESEVGRGGTGEESWSEGTDGEEAAAAGGDGVHGDGTGGLAGVAARTEEGQLPGGFRMLLEGLKLDNIDAVEPNRINLQVGCSRCGCLFDMAIAPDHSAAPSSRGTTLVAGSCPRCHSAASCSFKGRLVHHLSNVLGAVQCSGCVPHDLLPSVVAVQCSECNRLAALRGVQVGSRAQRVCGGCHSSMSLTFSSVTFSAMQPSGLGQHGAGKAGSSGGPSTRVQKAGAGVEFQAVLQLGEPLPGHGSCQHYKHSYRWLRFPCCGRRFPCDLCHEELTDGHEMQWAQRMVCGFCSTEQRVAERCINCNKRLAATAAAPSGRNTRFWEGGQGCRDPKRLNRNDPHKYRNSKAKTRSRKNERVGTAGANRTKTRSEG